MADSWQTPNDPAERTVPDPISLPAPRIRWAGLLSIVAFIAFVGLIARVLGPTAAAVVTVAAIFSPMLWSVLSRQRSEVSSSVSDVELGAPLWFGDGSGDAGGGDFGGGGVDL
jgi:uncharacterized membrane protein YgcG